MSDVQQYWTEFAPHQHEVLRNPVFELLDGGGRGSCKSVTLMAHTVTLDKARKRPRLAHPDYRGLVLRRSMPQLQELIDISHRVLPPAIPGIKFNASQSRWVAPSGGRLEMAFLEHDNQKERYWGRGYHDLLIDELEHWPNEDTYLWLHSSVRSSTPELPCFVRATANPTGPGAIWVRRRFVEPGPAGTLIQDGRISGHRSWRSYHHSIPQQNPWIGNDYVQGLRTLPKHLNRAFEHGDWYAGEGQFFDAWNDQIHVIEPFIIPWSWRRIRSIDWGYHEPSCVLWGAEDPSGNLVIYRELWESHLEPDALANKIVKIERDAGEYPVMGPCDAQCWEQGGHSYTIADRLIRGGVRMYRCRKGPNSRIHGAAEMHRRLRTFTTVRISDTETVKVPSIRFFKNCKWAIRTIPQLSVSKTNAEDVAEGGEDHGWDSLRYLLRARPMQRKEPAKIIQMSERLRDMSFEERWLSRRKYKRGN